MKVTGSHLIVQALRAEGIDQIFTLAGDHIGKNYDRLKSNN